MATEAPFKSFMAAGVPFAKVASKFRPKAAKVLAVQHHGAPEQYPTEHGTEVAHDGDYVVQVGTLRKQEIVPARTNPDGTRTPGSFRDVEEPKLVVMSREDFEGLNEPA